MTNRPKGKLFALLAIFVAIGLVTASGAFTSVAAQRTASVQTAGDAGAALQIQAVGDFASGTDTSELTLDFNNVNLNATTNFGVQFNITTPSTGGPYTIYIADDEAINVSGPSPTLGDVLDFTNGDSADGGTSIEGQSNAISVGSSTTVDIGVAVNTTNQGTQNFNGTFVIVAIDQSA